jgi:hypothetical protein
VSTQVFGSPDSFAIEYRAAGMPLYGAVRIWIRGISVGNIDSPMLLGTFAEGLNSMRGPRRTCSQLLFTHDRDVPPFDVLRGIPHWSFGEPFDDFAFVYYAVLELRAVYWVWSARDPFLRLQPEYPKGVHKAGVPFESYDSTVGEMLRALNVPDDVAPGVPWAFDPRKVRRHD